MKTVPRTWTIVTWLVAQAANDLGAVSRSLAELDADAYVLQSVTENDAEHIAEDLGEIGCAWELSHHPRSRLLPGSGLGLAILSQHQIADSVSVVTNNHSSRWSKERRIAQFAVVTRADHSAYTIGHAIGSPDPESMGHPPAPLVWFRPEQVGVDALHAVDLPDGASLISHETSRPIDHAPHLLSVAFEMPWVHGDFV